MICKPKHSFSIQERTPEGIDVRVGSTVNAGERDSWNALAARMSVFLDFGYTSAIDASTPALEYRYATYHRDGKLIGIAAFQLVWAEALDPSANISKGMPIIQSMAKSLMGERDLRRRILISGSCFTTGEHGFAFEPEVTLAQQATWMSLAAEMIVELEKQAQRKVSAVLVKDFFENSKARSNALKKEGYSPVNQEANMILPLPALWKNFDDYQEALTSKYRTKVRSVQRRSESLEERILSEEEVKTYAPQLHALYMNVRNRSSFRLGELGSEAFVQLFHELQDRFKIRAYFFEDEMIGFQCSIKNLCCLDAHLVGLNYKHNHRFALYQRMLCEFIREGIDEGYERINFGRTAHEIKSTLGAFPAEMHCYMKHTGKASNTFLKLFSGFVSPEPENTHLAFKISELSHFPDALTAAHQNR